MFMSSQSISAPSNPFFNLPHPASSLSTPPPFPNSVLLSLSQPQPFLVMSTLFFLIIPLYSTSPRLLSSHHTRLSPHSCSSSNSILLTPCSPSQLFSHPPSPTLHPHLFSHPISPPHPLLSVTLQLAPLSPSNSWLCPPF